MEARSFANEDKGLSLCSSSWSRSAIEGMAEYRVLGVVAAVDDGAMVGLSLMS